MSYYLNDGFQMFSYKRFYNWSHDPIKQHLLLNIISRWVIKWWISDVAPQVLAVSWEMTDSVTHQTTQKDITEVVWNFGQSFF